MAIQTYRDDLELSYRFLADELRDRGQVVADHQELKACRLGQVRRCRPIGADLASGPNRLRMTA